MKSTKILVLGLSVAVVGLSGCAAWKEDRDGRTAGRALDDSRVTERVEKALAEDPVYKHGNINVQTFRGVVLLNGFVEADVQRQRAEMIAREVPGVLELRNNLAVRPEPLVPTGRQFDERVYEQLPQGQGADQMQQDTQQGTASRQTQRQGQTTAEVYPEGQTNQVQRDFDQP